MSLHRILAPVVSFWRASLVAAIIPLPAIAQSAVDLYGDPLPKGAISRLGTVRFRQDGELLAASYSADGKSIWGFSTKTVYVWDAEDGRLARKLPIERHYVQFARVSADRQRAVTAGHHVDEVAGESLHTLKTWDLSQQRELSTLPLSRETRASCVAIDAHGTLVAIGGDQGTIRVIDLASGTELLSYAVSDRQIRSMSFSPDGERLLVGVENHPLILWKWADREVPEPVSPQLNDPRIFQWSRDGQRIAVAHYVKDGVDVLDGRTGELLGKLAEGPFFGAIGFIAFSPDDRLLAIYDFELKNVSLWDVETRHLVRPIGNESGRVFFSPDGQWLSSFESDPATIHTWNIETGKPSEYVAVGHRDAPSSIEFLPGDQVLATASDDGTLRFWDVKTGRQLRSFAHRPADTGAESVTLWIRAMDISPDGRLAATSSQDNTVRIWDVETGEEKLRLPGHGDVGGYRAVRFSPGGDRLASWGDDMVLRVWDTATGKALRKHPLHPSGVDVAKAGADFGGNFEWSMMLGFGAFSPDATRFILGIEPHDYYLFDVDSGQEISRITHNQTQVHSAAIAPSGERLLLGGAGVYRQIPLATGGDYFRPDNEFEVSLRQLPGSEPLKAWMLEGRHAESVAFDPAGDVFAVATSQIGEPIRVYAAASAELLAEIDGFDGVPRSLAFSHDGRLLSAGLSDSTALVWKWKLFTK